MDNKYVCLENQCVGCMSCVEVCPKQAVKIVDTLESYNAVIDTKKCVNCNACHAVCQNINPPALIEPIECTQGWAKDIQSREKSSSGGFAFEIAKQFIKQGGLVYSCSFFNGEFKFKLARTVDDLEEFRGSKYVKSNKMGIFRDIKSTLEQGERVLFIGLPCQVVGLKKMLKGRFENRFYTVDLICHGTPSSRLLEKFLEQYRINIGEISNISFRKNNEFNMYGDLKKIVPDGITDFYTLSFLKGLTYTSNCYSCRFAQIKRVSDITLGDAWGSCLPDDQQRKGISMALCQTNKGKELLHSANLELYPFDISTAIASNHQLDYPSKPPKGRRRFFDRLKNGGSFNLQVLYAYPKVCIRQYIKILLSKFGMNFGKNRIKKS